MCQFQIAGDSCGGAMSSKTTKFEGLLEAMRDALVVLLKHDGDGGPCR